MAQMPGVVPRNITKEDLDDPDLQRLNEYLRESATMANILAGAHGPIPISVPMDMQGNDLKNVSAATVAKLTVSDEAPTVPSDSLGLGSGTAAAATAGAAALPANPVGFLIFNLGGKQIKLPYYNP